MSTGIGSTGIGAAYLALIASDRVSAATRHALLERLKPDDPAYKPTVISPQALATLRAVVDRVLPQDGTPIDIAAQIDKALGEGGGDGWRFAAMPPDADAYQAALAALDAAAGQAHAAPFAALAADVRDAMLQQAAAGALDAPGFGADRMRLWFEEVRADVVKLYVAHPATLARMGYSGIGYGGDGPDKPGFSDLEPGGREPWEPLAALP